MKENYYDYLIKLAQKAAKKGEVPISAIIIKNNKMIASAYNKKNKKHDILGHAEIIAIKKASKKMKDWRLNECDLYVTLKPCSICENIIKNSRIRNVYYLLDKPENKKEYYKTEFLKLQNSENELMYGKILQDFFKKKRDKK